ncbi:MAG: dihydropteroate synthase, partial [Arthrobacter sp.]|nr:dihydropteroate synthase [Arthrobacter sp.]
DATAAVTAISAHRGAWAVRVHDVGPSLDAVKVAARMTPAQAPAAPAAGDN